MLCIKARIRHIYFTFLLAIAVNATPLKKCAINCDGPHKDIVRNTLKWTGQKRTMHGLLECVPLEVVLHINIFFCDSLHGYFDLVCIHTWIKCLRIMLIKKKSNRYTHSVEFKNMFSLMLCPASYLNIGHNIKFLRLFLLFMITYHLKQNLDILSTEFLLKWIMIPF